MSKGVDINSVAEQLNGRLSGQPTLPRSSFAVKEASADIDLYAEMERRAALYSEKMIDDAHKSVSLDGLDVKVLNNADRQREVLRTLGLEKRAALKEVAVQLHAIADRADAAGLRKQAADLRFAATKLV